MTRAQPGLVRRAAFAAALALGLSAAGPAAAQPAEIGSSSHFLQGGDVLPEGARPAIGQVTSSGGFCTGTLFQDGRVLTAAHCVCSGQTAPTGCTTRATFTMTGVFPVDDPATPVDESQTRGSVSVSGDVRVHPDYAAGGAWLLNDFATIALDTPVSALVRDVAPIPVERPDRPPAVGDTVTLVGYGRTGDNCADPGLGRKRAVEVEVSAVSDATIVFNNTQKYSCPGDSGGPALNEAGNLVGVSSHGDFATNSNYDPTYVAYPWLFGTGRVLRADGRLTMLRVHDVGTGFGPDTDRIEGEVVAALDTAPGSAFGFRLRPGQAGAAARGKLELLRKAMTLNRTVRLEYVVTGPANGQLIRVIELP